jgi:surface antigen
LDIRISPDVVLARERGKTRRGIFGFLALAVAALTVIMLINPATTQEYEPVCGLAEHEHTEACTEIVQKLICPLEETEGHIHGDACYAVQSVLVCTIPEGTVHEHTEDCIVWEETCVCGLEGDPEHVHTDECFEKTPVYVCGLEAGEHLHTEACYEEQKVLVCTIPEGMVHEHTEDCIRWEETCICGLEDDPEHVHTDECFVKTPVFVCEPEEGAGHVHNDLCYQEETVYTCGLSAHVHTDACFPKLTGDPHADVEIDLDWESTFCNVELTGNWAEDLVAIARSQAGYTESERNFVTDEYNVRHGYTRYGDWNGTRYAGWNGLYVMFCLHYAGVWNIPTDPVPANWMNAAKAQGFLKDELPLPGDLVFFDDNADGFADRVAIVTEVREDGFDMISGGTGKPVEEETTAYDSDKLIGYLALPQNPDYVTLEETTEKTDTLEAQAPDVRAEETIPDEQVPLANPYAPVTLFAETEDGVRATLNGTPGAFPYPAEELTLMIRDTDGYAEQADVTAAAESEGAKPLSVRWLDISVWHEEAVPVPDETAPFTAEVGDNAGLTAEAPAEEITDAPVEDVPAETETEKQLVKVIPEGPVEITVEGLDESGSIWVYRMGEEGTAERLNAEADETQRGRVKVTTGLN